MGLVKTRRLRIRPLRGVATHGESNTLSDAEASACAEASTFAEATVDESTD